VTKPLDNAEPGGLSTPGKRVVMVALLWLVGTPLLILSLVALAFEAFSWLYDGVWRTSSVKDGLEAVGLSLPQTSSRGEQRILHWIGECSLALVSGYVGGWCLGIATLVGSVGSAKQSSQ
jgi:hypothetical protein